MEKLSEINYLESEKGVIFLIFDNIKVSRVPYFVNRALPSLNRWSLEITLTVPLKGGTGNIWWLN